jgi:hypothetical protein
MQRVPTLARAYRVMGVLGALVATAVVFVPVAQAAEPVFACRATALRAPILGEQQVANPGYVPCQNASKSATGEVKVPGLLSAFGLQAVTSTTSTTPSGAIVAAGGAVANVAYAAINVLNVIKLQVYGVSSTAGRKCLTNLAPPDIGGSSAIAAINLNGKILPVSIPLKIPLGIVTIYVNYGVKTANEVLTRAVWVDFPGTANDIVISEARGGAAPGGICGSSTA